jgi:hypothetical protein
MMNGLQLTKEMILLILPLVVIQLGLAIYCALKIFREGVQNLNKWLWLVICVFVNLLGPMLFMIIGRKKAY